MQPFTRRFTAVPVSAEYPVLLKIAGRCQTGEVYTPSRDAQTVCVCAIAWLRLPRALFRLFLSASILLPTIDTAARLCEIAINITLLYFSDIDLYAQGS